MKCGYKTPTKLSPSKFKQDVSPTKHAHVSPTKHAHVSPTKHDLGPCKEQELSPKVGYSDSSVEHLSPSRVNIIQENRPVNNKENLLRRLSAVENNDLECSPLQDSGYSSVLLNDSQSQDEEDFSSSITSVALFETPKQTSQEKAAPVYVNTHSLPVLRFEEAVCSTLKKGLRSRPKAVFDTVEELVSREAFGLNNLIGKKMGLERLDILGELFLRDFKHLISKIFRHLSAIDLINVISVSTTWRKALQDNKWSYSVYKQCHKEICEKEARKTEHTATRDSSQLRIPLYSVQKVASAACCISKKKSINKKNKPCSSNSRYSEFTEVGKTLINDQSLKVCRDCGSPAKYNSYQHRAVCTRESCQLDFCTLCNCKYHFSKDCTTSKPQSHRSLSEPLPGSRKSKQNLRRL